MERRKASYCTRVFLIGTLTSTVAESEHSLVNSRSIACRALLIDSEVWMVVNFRT